MTNFYEILQDGTIGRSTTDADLAEVLGLNETTELPIIYAWNGKRYIKGTAPVAPEPSYQEKRVLEYPTLPEQLDMIYWDKVNGTNVWQTTIASIKTKYPKS